MKDKDLVIEIGDKKIYTNMFRMGDLERLFLLKHEIDYALKKDDAKRAYTLYIDYIDKLYPDIEKEFREYVMINTIVASEGKSNYKLQYECDKCGSENGAMMEIGLNYSLYGHVLPNKFIIKFKYSGRNDHDASGIYDLVDGVEIHSNYIKWELLSEDSKEKLFSYIDHDQYTEIFENTQMCRATIHSQSKKCCEEGNHFPRKMELYGGYKIFCVLINSANLPVLYKTNHELLSRGISLTDQMLMKPFERSIYVNMILQKEKEESDKYAKDGIS